MLRTCIAVGLLVAFSSAAEATVLVAGDNPVAGTTAASEPQLAGPIIADITTPVSFTVTGGTFNATVQSRVVQSIDGTLDFYWRIFGITYTGTDGNAINALRVAGFGSVLGDNGNFRLDGSGTQGPDIIRVFTSPDGFNFIFSNGLSAGTDSYFMFIDTNATNYSQTAFFDLVGMGISGISTTFPTFAPAPPIPEPATWAMMLVGFGALGIAFRRAPKAVQTV